MKTSFLGNAVSGTSIFMCIYNFLALKSLSFNVFATWQEGEHP